MKARVGGGCESLRLRSDICDCDLILDTDTMDDDYSFCVQSTTNRDAKSRLASRSNGDKSDLINVIGVWCKLSFVFNFSFVDILGNIAFWILNNFIYKIAGMSFNVYLFLF